ncbi:hypothetical protein F5B22DRAFT_643353 [Xylaria bambusicola]|uniref:uncharacterized protein n=1 Tax=Xylaria bambusicola TaxID=326684 RepID=UPI0020088DC0|nr:uncharacterized protein F5B22DRAFT_643353 [Xylaria bambusicola]KAI0521761.1 hypothetical protein F5B22DRAFT_643353 [Xylaria bambusicola]
MSNTPPLQQEQREFRLFPRLPTEIRWMIWRCTWTPKTVEVELKVPAPIIRCPDDGYDRLPCITDSSGMEVLPISSQVNKESRHETLMFYRPSFVRDDGVWKVQDGHSYFNGYCYFNFHLDNLYTGRQHWIRRWLGTDNCRQLQRLTVSSSFFLPPSQPRSSFPAPGLPAKSVTKSFEAREIDEFLDNNYPKLSEITMIDMTWETKIQPFQL